MPLLTAFLILMAIGGRPWTAQGLAVAMETRVEVHEAPCPTMAWYDPRDDTVNLCGDMYISTAIYMVRHEMQHRLAYHYRVFPDGREPCAMLYVASEAIKAPPYADWQVYLVQPTEFNCSLLTEVHAEIPTALAGSVPASLSFWYPRFSTVD